MTLKSRIFNIHGIIKFRLEYPSSYSYWLLGDPFDKYRYYEVKDCPEPVDFIVRIKKPIFDYTNKSYISSGKYYFEFDSIQSKADFYKLINWQFAIRGFEDNKNPIELDICGDSLSIRWIPNYVDFLIHYIATKRDAAIIHASGITKDGAGYFFSSRSGAGKTKLSLEFVNQTKTFSFLGDNYIIIKNKKLFNFITAMSMYSYNLSAELREKINFEVKLKLFFSDVISNLSSGRLRISTPIIFGDLLPHRIENDVFIKNGFIILPKYKYNKIDVIEINKSKFIKFLIENQKCEFLPIIKYIMNYSYFYPDNSLEMHWKIYKHILEINLNNAQLFQIQVPTRFDPDKIVKKIGEIINE